MAKIIGVRFKPVGKIYYFDTDKYKVNVGDMVIVETPRGIECGWVVLKSRSSNNDFGYRITKIKRRANHNDFRKYKNNLKKAKFAFEVCVRKIKQNKLPMNLIDVECAFDNSKMIFYFTANSRIDFRMLVKDLALIFKTRIELRQIGVRDEAKVLGGLGGCGRPLCCNSFLSEFKPVSIKMAKEQCLSLNSIKISGTCGRLMCCLKYEQETYQELLDKNPKCGAIVKTAKGEGTVLDVNLLTGNLKVKLNNSLSEFPFDFNSKDVEIIKDGKISFDKCEMEYLKKLE